MPTPRGDVVGLLQGTMGGSYLGTQAAGFTVAAVPPTFNFEGWAVLVR